MSVSKLSLASTFVFTGLLAHAAAQPASELPPMPPPPPPSASGAEPPSTAQPAPAQCVPSCRAGFLCHEGQCVSACNPPCAAGQTCSANGECLAPTTRSVAPPVFPMEAPIARPPDTGKERHDGFMLRMALGLGGGSTTQKASVSATASTKTDLSGGAGTFSLDIGGAPSENLVIHGRLADMVIVNPSVSVNGTALGQANSANVDAFVFGPGITYYFMPINIYLTGVIALSWLSVTSSGNKSASTKVGPGLNVDVGKEWWVSDNWGLGIAARFWYGHSTATSTGVSFTYDVAAGAVLFSATYQ